jgi:hypothetical protein
VVVTDNLADFLRAAGLQPDVNISDDMRFLHRTSPAAEIYWINKPSRESRKVSLSFRVTGREPQVWHPDTGLTERVSYRIADGRTVVDLDLVSDDAVFVVFGGKGSDSLSLPAREEQTLLTMEGPWEVRFQERRGAPAVATFDKLQSYTEFKEPGIK